MGVLTAYWVRAELADRMRLNNGAASYGSARTFAGFGYREQVDHLAPAPMK